MSLNVHQTVLGDRSPVTFGCNYVLTSRARPTVDMTVTQVSAKKCTYTWGDESSGFCATEGGVFSIDGCAAQRYWNHVTAKDGYSNGKTLLRVPYIQVIVADGFHMKIMKPEYLMKGVAPYFPTDIKKEKHFDSFHCTEAQAGMRPQPEVYLDSSSSSPSSSSSSSSSLISEGKQRMAALEDDLERVEQEMNEVCYDPRDSWV